MTDGVGTASWIEIAWTLATALGIIGNGWGLAEAVADRSFLRGAGLNGRRELVATWHVRLNGGLLYVQTAFLVAGITAMLTPPAATSNARVARTVTELMLLSAEPVLVGLALQAQRYRGRILASRRIENVTTASLEDEAVRDPA